MRKFLSMVPVQVFRLPNWLSSSITTFPASSTAQVEIEVYSLGLYGQVPFWMTLMDAFQVPESCERVITGLMSWSRGKYLHPMPITISISINIRVRSIGVKIIGDKKL